MRRRRRSAAAGADAQTNAWSNGLDAWQREILFCDALCQRAGISMEHERVGRPPLLDCKVDGLRAPIAGGDFQGIRNRPHEARRRQRGDLRTPLRKKDRAHAGPHVNDKTTRTDQTS